jgi:hypothetical protein
MLNHWKKMLLGGLVSAQGEGGSRVKEACPFAGIIQIKFCRYFSDQTVTISLCCLGSNRSCGDTEGGKENKSSKSKAVTRIEHPDAFLFLGFTLVFTQWVKVLREASCLA